MNRYLLLSAAALLASTTSGDAGTTSFTFASTNGTPNCDGGTVSNSGDAWAWTHTNANCSGGTSIGQGIVGKSGKNSIATLSDNYESKQQIATESVSYVLPQKLKTGGRWEMWVEVGGVSSYEGAHGIIIVDAPHHQAPGKSTLAAVTRLIEQGRETGSTRGTAR